MHEVDPATLAEQLRAVAAEPRTAAVAPGGVEQAARTRGAASPTARSESLEALSAEGLPVARSLRRAEIEARSAFAVYAPDWGDEAAWGPALDAWLDTFTDADDVTLGPLRGRRRRRDRRPHHGPPGRP